MGTRRLMPLLLGLLAILFIPLTTSPVAQEVPLPAPGDLVQPRVGADTSPDGIMVCPEVIWAPATGGGTWVSRLQLMAKNPGTVIKAWFFYGTSVTPVVDLMTSTVPFQSVLYSNILASLSTLTGVNLFGKVGTLVLQSQDASQPILADVETLNGNYGKSFPGLRYIDDNAINYGRQGLMQNLTNTASWRTFVGCWNSTNYRVGVWFNLMDPVGTPVGYLIQVFIDPKAFVSFNPFVEAGVAASSLDNYRLLATLFTTTQPSPYPLGVFVFGSKANNLTNDSMALFCKPWP